MTISASSSGCSCKTDGAYGAQAGSTDALRELGKQRFKEMKALRSAIKSGDVAAAQKAFDVLKKDLQANPKDPQATQLLDPKTALGKDFAALESVIKSGKVDDIQKAFATFQQDMRANRSGHAHRAHPDHDGDGDDHGPVTPPANAQSPLSKGLDAVA